MGNVIKTVFLVSTRNTDTGTMRKWPALVGTVVANVGRELSLLKMAINMANADYLTFFLWNELEPRCQQRAAGSLELLCTALVPCIHLLLGQCAGRLWKCLFHWWHLSKRLSKLVQHQHYNVVCGGNEQHTVQEQGWGLLSRFPLFCYFLNFSALWKHTLDIEYHVSIWQVSNINVIQII